MLVLLLGIFCILYEDKFIDRIICKLGIIINCILLFWVVLVFIFIFSINLSIFLSSGVYLMGEEFSILSRILYLILFFIVFILSYLWYYIYMIRNKLLEEIREDYVFLCKVKGLNNRIIVFKYCLRNIMLLYISIMVILIFYILGGIYVVEKVFFYFGLGIFCFESVKYYDYNMLLVLCLIIGVLVVFGNMLV